jgi:hypothetical protein
MFPRLFWSIPLNTTSSAEATGGLLCIDPKFEIEIGNDPNKQQLAKWK